MAYSVDFQILLTTCPDYSAYTSNLSLCPQLRFVVYQTN